MRRARGSGEVVRHDLAGEGHRRAGERRMRGDAMPDHHDMGLLDAGSQAWSRESNARRPLYQGDVVFDAVATCGGRANVLRIDPGYGGDADLRLDL